MPSDYTVAQLLQAELSYDQVTKMLHWGNIDSRTFERWCLFSDWAAPRFSGCAGFKQERFYNRFGKEAYWRRIERIRRLHDKIKNS